MIQIKAQPGQADRRHENQLSNADLMPFCASLRRRESLKGTLLKSQLTGPGAITDNISVAKC